MELLLSQYHATGRVPQPSEISAQERFMRPAIYDTMSPSALASGLPVLRMGRALEDVICASASAQQQQGGRASGEGEQEQEQEDQLPRLARFFDGEMYLVNARVRTSDGD